MDGIFVERIWRLISPFRLDIRTFRFFGFLRGPTRFASSWFRGLFFMFSRCYGYLGTTRLAGRWLRLSSRRCVIPKLLRRLRPNLGRSVLDKSDKLRNIAIKFYFFKYICKNRFFYLPAMFHRPLGTSLALRRSTGFPSGGNRFWSIVLSESEYSARITGPFRRRFSRGIRWKPECGIKSGVVDDIPRYHASHLLFVDKLLR